MTLPDGADSTGGTQSIFDAVAADLGDPFQVGREIRLYITMSRMCTALEKLGLA